MLIQVVLAVERALLKCSLVAGLKVMSFEMCIIRLGLTTEYTAHESGIQLQCPRAVEGTNPLLYWKVQ